MRKTLKKPGIVKWVDGNPIVRLTYRGEAYEHAVGNLTADGKNNTKLRKNGKTGEYLTLGLSLAPVRSAGVGNVCPHASKGCAASCLDHQGIGAVYALPHIARIAKTIAYYRARNWFVERLRAEIGIGAANANRHSLRLAVRLNVFSDVPWEKVAPNLLADFPDVEFYDYTKNPRRTGLLADNYWVTFSRSETNHVDCLRVLRAGSNVAVVFDPGGTSTWMRTREDRPRMPKTWFGFDVIDGDKSDRRYQDPRGRTRGKVVGLWLKSASNYERAAAIKSGFAIPKRGSK